MGQITGLKKAALQVRSTYENATTNKSFDILNEKIDLDTAQDTGDKLLLSNLVRAIYSKSYREVASASVVGTSNDVLVY